MKTHTRVIVIGGGVVGCSILYHLTRLGWSDVVLLERKELTAGSTWQAAGGFHTINGDPNVARFGAYADKDYTLARAGEFYERRMRMTYPNEFWPAGRPARTTQLYQTFLEDNAMFGVSDGLEMPMYFAPAGEEPVETPSFHRSNAFAAVGEECRAVRTSAGILDTSGYGKYEISGAGAGAWLDRGLEAPAYDPGGEKLRK